MPPSHYVHPPPPCPQNLLSTDTRTGPSPSPGDHGPLPVSLGPALLAAAHARSLTTGGLPALLSLLSLTSVQGGTRGSGSLLLRLNDVPSHPGPPATCLGGGPPSCSWECFCYERACTDVCVPVPLLGAHLGRFAILPAPTGKFQSLHILRCSGKPLQQVRGAVSWGPPFASP